MTKTVLRTLVVTEIVLLAATILTVFFPSQTTPAIDEYLEGPGAGSLMHFVETAPNSVVYSLGAVFIVILAIYAASLIGLLLLKPWSRRLYVVSFVVGVCIHPFAGSSLVDPISGMIEFLAAACSGAILATLYLSDAKAHFDVHAARIKP